MKLSIPQLILLPLLAYSGYFIAGEEPISTWLTEHATRSEETPNVKSPAISKSRPTVKSTSATPITKKTPQKPSPRPTVKEVAKKSTPATATEFSRYSDFILTPAYLSDSLKGEIPYSSYKGAHLSKKQLSKAHAAKRVNQPNLSTPDAAGTITLRYYDSTARGNLVSWDFWNPSSTVYQVFITLKDPNKPFNGFIKYNGKKIAIADNNVASPLVAKRANKQSILIAASNGSSTSNVQSIYLVPEENLANYEKDRPTHSPTPDLKKIPKEMVTKMENIASAGYDIHTTIPQQMKSGKNGYLIITTEAKRAALTNLYAFIHHKEQRGFNVTVVTEKDFGGGTGSKAAHNIRKWLQKNHKTKNALYALMLGNPHPTNGDIPYKNCGPAAESNGGDAFGQTKEQLEGNYPTDYFYADLDSNWDLNNNGFYGDDEDFADGGINGQPNLYVGRIPFHEIKSARRIDQILERIIRYENQAGGLTSRHDLFFTGYDENRLASIYDGFFKHNSAKLILHSKDHTAPFLANIKRPKIKDTVATLNSEKLGFVFYQAEDPDDTFLTNDDVAKLSPPSPPVYSIKGIGAADPNNQGNLAFALLRNSAIAVYAPTKEIDGYEDFEEYHHAAYYSRLHFGMSSGEAFWTTLGDQTRDRGVSEAQFLATFLGDPSVVPMPRTSGPTLSVSPGFDIRIDADEEREMDYEVRNNGTTPDNYSIKSVAQLSVSETTFTLEPGEAKTVKVKLNSNVPLNKGINKFTIHVASSAHKKQRHFIIVK